MPPYNHLAGKGVEVRDEPQKVMAPGLQRFTDEQAASAVELIARVVNVAGSASDLQCRLIDSVARLLRAKKPVTRGTWS